MKQEKSERFPATNLFRGTTAECWASPPVAVAQSYIRGQCAMLRDNLVEAHATVQSIEVLVSKQTRSNKVKL